MGSEFTELEKNILSEAQQYFTEAKFYTGGNAVSQEEADEMESTIEALNRHYFMYNYNACETLCGLGRYNNNSFSEELMKIYDDLMELYGSFIGGSEPADEDSKLMVHASS